MRAVTVITVMAVQASLASAQTPARNASRQPVVAKTTTRPTSTPRAAATVSKAPTRIRPRVVIDAGHGGKDPGGPMTGAFAEKDIALQVAVRVGDALRTKG